MRAILRRVAFACGLIVFVAAVAVSGGGGYTDVTGDPISLLDAFYSASVTVPTTGYGDITAVMSGKAPRDAVADHARAHRVPDPRGRHDGGATGESAANGDRVSVEALDRLVVVRESAIGLPSN